MSPTSRSSSSNVSRAGLDVEQLLVVTRSLLESSHQLLVEFKASITSAQQHQQAVAAQQQSLETLQHTVRELDRTVRTGNGDSLVTQARLLGEHCRRLDALHAELLQRIDLHDERLEELLRQQLQSISSHRTLTQVFAVLGWVIATLISVASIWWSR